MRAYKRFFEGYIKILNCFDKKDLMGVKENFKFVEHIHLKLKLSKTNVCTTFVSDPFVLSNVGNIWQII